MPKCPLFIRNDVRVQLGEETEIGDCIKAECAWYTPVGCAVIELASAPRKLAGALNDINWSIQAHKIGQSVDIKHE